MVFAKNYYYTKTSQYFWPLAKTANLQTFIPFKGREFTTRRIDSQLFQLLLPEELLQLPFCLTMQANHLAETSCVAISRVG